jgi:hypothetical protein
MKIICVKDNITYCDRCYEDMLLSNKISAYYEATKQLKQINKGDLILLYHKDWKVIAVGFAISDVLTNDMLKKNDIESFVYVNWIFKANKDLKNSIDYRNIADGNPPPPTVSPVYSINSVKLFEEISKNQNFIE